MAEVESLSRDAPVFPPSRRPGAFCSSHPPLRATLTDRVEVFMLITDKMIDQAYSDLKSTCGGVRNDYFGLLVLETEYKIPREVAVNQIGFGGNDYGIDGFHFDTERGNLYLYQFKYSTSSAQFKPSLQRLIDAGIARVFLTTHQDPNKNQLLMQLRSCMIENRELVKQVYVRFVFTGDPAEVDRSQAIDKLREDLDNKKHLVNEFFKRETPFVIEFLSTTGKRIIDDPPPSRPYPLHLDGFLSSPGPSGESMHVGFVRLKDLWVMYQDMGQRFFERNIRSALPDDKAVNRALLRALRQIVIDGKEAPSVFAFNHNGITLAAEKLEQLEGFYQITAPRLLNGAQTVTTLGRFLKAQADNPRLQERQYALDEIRVLCKVITGACPEFVTTVTVNNNRQNPVEPWNLRANDLIQLELQDKFRDDLGIYYERQQNAFRNLSPDELESTRITESKPIELKKLAETFSVADGEIDKLNRMREVFSDDKAYGGIFHQGRLTADSRQILLCYKIQFRLRRLLNDVVEKGRSKYGYLSKARNLLWALLCQAVLNDPDLKRYAESFGSRLVIEPSYTDYLAKLATTRCRFLMSDLLNEPNYAAKAALGNFAFLKTNTAWKRCMEFAHNRYGWVEKRLR
jgi:AIPR protein